MSSSQKRIRNELLDKVEDVKWEIKYKLRVTDKEDGIPVFLYKAIISSESISKDKLSLNIR